MSFDPDAYLASRRSSFDPDAYLAKKAGASKGDAVAAAVEGFGQGASMGYLPQLQAAVGSILPDPNADLDAKLKAEGFNLQQPEDTYLSLRDENLKRQAALSESNPYIYGGAQLAGLVSTAPVAEMGAAKLVGNAGRLARAAGTGALIGAVQNPGDELGKIAPLQAKERGQNALLGAAVGSAGDFAARGLEKGARAVGELAGDLKDSAYTNALRSLGGQKSQLKKLNAKGRTEEVAKFALDNDLAVSELSGKELVSRVNSLKSQAAGEIGAVSNALEKAGEKGAFDRKDIANKMRTTLLEDVGDSIDADTLLPKFEKYIDGFEKKAGDASIKEIQDLRQQFDGRVNFSKRQGDLSENEAVFKGWRRLFAGEVEAKADSLGGDIGNRLRAANKKYSLAAEAGKLAENKADQAGNNYFGLTDKIAGASLGAANAARGDDLGERLANGLVGAAAGAAGAKAVRTFGPTLGTKGLLAASRAAESLAPGAAVVEDLSAPVINRLRLKALETESVPRKKLPKNSRARLRAMGDE